MAQSGGMEAPALRSKARVALVGGGIACLVGAGLLLWTYRGDAVFSDLVLTALAWCF